MVDDAHPDARRFSLLVSAIQRLSLVTSVAEVQEIVRTAARELADADGATFVLRDGDQCFYADEDAIAPLWKGQRFPLSACVSGWSMLHREAVVIPDIYGDARVPHEAYRPTFVKSMLMVPIRQIDPLGALGLYWASHHEATPSQVNLLQALADSTAVALEICARREGEHEARQLALVDPLTGSANRRAWDLEMAQAVRVGQRFSIAILDLDGLKGVNDRFGHEAGDRLLRGAAAAWRSHLRAGDLLARIGGDEFALWLPGLDLATAEVVVGRLVDADGDSSTSVGVAQWDGAELPDTLLARADAALYDAKRSGRGRAAVAR